MVHCVYQPLDNMIDEPDNIKIALYSTSMQILKINKARRIITRQVFYCVQLMSISTFAESFNDQCYLKADGTESCGHFNLIESHEIDTTCAKYCKRENRTEWIHCLHCCQWIYELRCFLHLILLIWLI